MICFKVIEESLLRFPVLGSQKRRKKKHGQIRVKLLFIKYDDKSVLSCSAELLLFKTYNISTANLCIDHFLTTTKCNFVLSL